MNCASFKLVRKYRQKPALYIKSTVFVIPCTGGSLFETGLGSRQNYATIPAPVPKQIRVVNYAPAALESQIQLQP